MRKSTPALIKKTSKFYGDGRISLSPGPTLRGINVRRSTAQMMIERFMAGEISQHGAAMATVWVLVEYCEEHNEALQIDSTPGLGATVVRISK